MFALETSFIIINYAIAIGTVCLGVSMLVGTFVYLYKTIVEQRRLSKEAEARLKFLEEVAINQSEQIRDINRKLGINSTQS